MSAGLRWLLLVFLLIFTRGLCGAEELSIRVPPNVQDQKLIKRVRPVYPPNFRDMIVYGIVRFNVLIDKNGRVAHLALVTGNPLLAHAAGAAATKWVYEPTLLNGQPVEVITQIDVAVSPWPELLYYPEEEATQR